MPKASEEAAAALHDMVSPMSAFVRDCCDRGPDLEVVIDHLYAAYQDWCRKNGMKPLPAQLFGRDLRAVLYGLRIS